MARVFFTSDLHFGHKNLCQGLRGMTSEDSDQLIINNWNKVVTKRDIVYVLGDITMENQNDIPKYIKQLNGRIILIGGNHVLAAGQCTRGKLQGRMNAAHRLHNEGNSRIGKDRLRVVDHPIAVGRIGEIPQIQNIFYVNVLAHRFTYVGRAFVNQRNDTAAYHAEADYCNFLHSYCPFRHPSPREMGEIKIHQGLYHILPSYARQIQYFSATRSTSV